MASANALIVVNISVWDDPWVPFYGWKTSNQNPKIIQCHITFTTHGTLKFIRWDHENLRSCLFDEEDLLIR